MNNHNEVIETLELIEEIKEVGIDKLDLGDYKIIENFIDQLTPYNNMVMTTQNNLEIKLEEEFSNEVQDQLHFYKAKASMIDELIEVLKWCLSKIQL